MDLIISTSRCWKISENRRHCNPQIESNRKTDDQKASEPHQLAQLRLGAAVDEELGRRRRVADAEEVVELCPQRRLLPRVAAREVDLCEEGGKV